jgi:two-component system chemotaxis response regulator CheB
LVVLARRLAQTVGSGSADRRYNEVAEEAEQAMPVLGKRLMESSADGGNPDGG